MKILTTGIKAPAKRVIIPIMLLIIVIFVAEVSITIDIVNISKTITEKQKTLAQYSEISDKLNEGSEILTSNIRLFVSTAIPKYIDAYFYELKVNQKREKAIAELSQIHENHIVSMQIKEAMRYSQELTSLEFHAMKLIALADHIPVFQYPEITMFKLPRSELVLSPKDKNPQLSPLFLDRNISVRNFRS